MYVHNYDNGDDYVDDPVTLISRLDMSDLSHLHPNGSTTLTVVSIKLKGTKNDQVWSCAMLLDLEGTNKTGFIDGSCRRSHKDEFLMGLDDSYMQIKSSILSREVLPDVRSAYPTISSEESHRVTSGSVSGSSQRNQATAFVFIVPNRRTIQRSQFSNTTPRPNKLNNNRQSGVIVNGKIVDIGANQHMTNSDRELDNVYDISHLKIKVGYPNGIEAFISKIGNLKLPNCLVLFHVLVIPEYCVTLISVHKLAKDNKICVAFDESRCYFLNQDMNLKKVLAIGNQCGGIYYFNDQDLWGPYKNGVTERKHMHLLNVARLPSSVLNGKSPYERYEHLDFSDNISRNDAQNSDDIFAAQDEQITTLEDNINSESNLVQNPNVSTHGTQKLRRSSRQSVFPKNYNDFVVDSKVKYGLENVRSTVKLLPEIKGLLQMNPTREKLFRDTVFGLWLDIQSYENDNHLMHYVLQHQCDEVRGNCIEHHKGQGGQTKDGDFVEGLDETVGPNNNLDSIEEGDGVLDFDVDGVHLSQINADIQQP
ncbi:ribonuclease H-like domain-containing protein [Tanacetum coccineum]